MTTSIDDIMDWEPKNEEEYAEALLIQADLERAIHGKPQIDKGMLETAMRHLKRINRRNMITKRLFSLYGLDITENLDKVLDILKDIRNEDS